MASAYVAEIRSVRPSGPYFIAGTCTGGVVAYEMARQLRAGGEEVALAIVESWHPSSYRTLTALTALGKVRFVAAKLVSYARSMLSLSPWRWQGFVRAKLGLAATLIDGGLDETLAHSSYHADNVRLATLNAVAGYRPPPYAGRLLNVVATQRPVGADVIDTRRDWETLAAGGADVTYMPAADSGRLFVSPHVDELAGHLETFATAQLEPR